MAPNPLIMKSVEQLDYRVTVGDVAAQTGLNVNVAQQQLLDLASNAGGNLQVAETGDILYQFPRNFRRVLQQKYWRLRLQAWWQRVSKTLFYLVRISFGIILVASILLMLVAILLIITAANSSEDNDRRSSSYGGGGGIYFLPRFWIGPDIFWFFDPNYSYYRRQRQYQNQSGSQQSQMSFLEAVFSFIFGDGNPNYDLEERRWRQIGAVIQNNGGAVAAEQIAPYWDEIDRSSWEEEGYMLPILSKFNGYPHVSPQGEIVYAFPELQVTAKQRQTQSISAYLKEQLWPFSQASSGKLTLAGGLGVVNIVLAVVLGNLLRSGAAAQLGGIVAFAASIYGLLLGYGVLYLLIPLVRYFWIQAKNAKITSRNQMRQERAQLLNEADANLQAKIGFARQFAAERILSNSDIAYSTDQDLLDQEIANRDKLDQQWQQRLDQ